MSDDTLLGLPVRWRTAFDWRIGGALPPCPLSTVVAARAGDRVVGLDPETGALVWETHVETLGLDGFVFTAHDGLAITNWRDDDTRRSHIVAVDEQGTKQWDVELPGSIGFGTTALDDGSIASPVLGTSWQLAVVDPRGQLTLHDLPTTGSVVARHRSGQWFVGAGTTGAGKATLYKLANGSVVEAPTAPASVLFLDCADDTVVTNERTSEGLRLVARDLELAKRWSQPISEAAMTVCGDRVVSVTGAIERPVPTAFDLASGEIRWQAPPLADRFGGLAADRDLLLFIHDEGATLLTDEGELLGEFDGFVSRSITVTDDAVYLFANKAAVCLERI